MCLLQLLLLLAVKPCRVLWCCSWGTGLAMTGTLLLLAEIACLRAVAVNIP